MRARNLTLLEFVGGLKTRVGIDFGIAIMLVASFIAFASAGLCKHEIELVRGS